MSAIKLIVGLGNPGEHYAKTRHNAGEWLVERLANAFNVSLKDDKKFFAKTANVVINNQEVRFLIPTTYMNLSGKAVSAIARFYRINLDEILIIHDELDLIPGVAKFKLGGGDGGHNGLKDIIAQFSGNKNFYRLRIGIGHPGDKTLVPSYVLNKPSLTDIQLIDRALTNAANAVELVFKDTMTKATNYLNALK